MQVDAVKNFTNVNSTTFNGRKKSSESEYVDNKWRTMEQMEANDARHRKFSNALKNYALAGLIGTSAALGGVGCSSDNSIDIEHIHEIKCPVDTGMKKDTVYIKEYVPGETVFIHDTIVNDKHDTVVVEKPIYIPGDTVWVVPNFDSEVADTLNNDLCDLGIDCGEGIPVQMIFNDEWNVTNNALKLNGKQTSAGRLVYDNTSTGWYDDKNYMRAELSVAKNKGLIVQLKKSVIDGVKPTDDLGWKLYDTYVLQNVGGKLLKLRPKDSGALEKFGTITRGDKERSVFNNTDLPNGETETWRYSDWKVKRHNLTLDDLYNDFVEQKKNQNN